MSYLGHLPVLLVLAATDSALRSHLSLVAILLMLVKLSALVRKMCGHVGSWFSIVKAARCWAFG